MVALHLHQMSRCTDIPNKYIIIPSYFLRFNEIRHPQIAIKIKSRIEFERTGEKITGALFLYTFCFTYGRNEIMRDSFFVSNHIFSFGLSPIEFYVYCYLCRCRNLKAGGTCFQASKPLQSPAAFPNAR